MKILQLVYNLGSGGAEKFVVNLCNELDSLGHEVEICMIKKDDGSPLQSFNKQFLNHSIKFKSLECSDGINISKIAKVSNYIRKSSAEIVHCHGNVQPYIYPLLLFPKNKTYFHTLHSLADKLEVPKYQKPIDTWFYRKLKLHPIAISRICEKSFVKVHKTHNIDIIENGCIPQPQTSNFNDVLEYVNRLKSDDNNIPIFIHVARLGKAKNQSMLVEAFNKLYEQGVKYRLLIIGDYFDREEGIELQKKSCPWIKYLGVKNNVGDYLAASDYFVLTSIWEGLPISLIEALAQGLTPICTPAGGIPDVINSSNGYLSSDFTSDTFVKAVKEAINNPIDRQYLKSSYNERFSMRKCANRYLSVYMKYSN